MFIPELGMYLPSTLLRSLKILERSALGGNPGNNPIPAPMPGIPAPIPGMPPPMPGRTGSFAGGALEDVLVVPAPVELPSAVVLPIPAIGKLPIPGIRKLLVPGLVAPPPPAGGRNWEKSKPWLQK